jgi:hypothetical protein
MSNKVLVAVVFLGLVIGVIRLSLIRQDRDVTIQLSKAQNTKNALEIQKLKLQVSAGSDVFEACSGELLNTNNRLDACYFDKQLAETNAQPCPGPCNLPDCRELQRVIEVNKVCLGFMANVQKSLAGMK